MESFVDELDGAMGLRAEVGARRARCGARERWRERWWTARMDGAEVADIDGASAAACDGRVGPSLFIPFRLRRAGPRKTCESTTDTHNGVAPERRRGEGAFGGMRAVRVIALVLALILAPRVEDESRMNASHLDASVHHRWGGGVSLARALHDGNDTDHTVGVTVDENGNPIGDAVTQPARSMVGFVQDCSGFPPTQSGTLCGARGAYLHDHYLYVAATQVDTISVVDVYRPDMPTVAGSVTHPKVLKGVVATWMHRSGEYVVAVARGRRPEGFGHVVLLDVRYVSFYFRVGNYYDVVFCLLN